jgi:hypothetical protein
LLLATAFKRNKPKGCCLDTVAAGRQQPVIFMNRGFDAFERLSDA